MKFLNRISNIWKSGANEEQPKPRWIVDEYDAINTPEGHAKLHRREPIRTVFIPHNAVDPIKELVNELPQ